MRSSSSTVQRTADAMSVATWVIYATVTIVAVLYSGGLALYTIFGVPIGVAVWGIGLIAAGLHDVRGLAAGGVGGSRPGIALLIGGVVTMAIGLHAWAGGHVRGGQAPSGST